jgi:hypothetical protein
MRDLYEHVARFDESSEPFESASPARPNGWRFHERIRASAREFGSGVVMRIDRPQPLQTQVA